MSLPEPSARPFPISSWLRGERRSVTEAVTVGLLVVVVHVLFRLSAGFLVGVLNDDGVYVAVGRAIADGMGYRSIHLVGTPPPLQVRYPPGLPLLLAVPWALGGTLGAVRATVAILHPVVTGAAAALVWWTGRQHLELSAWPLAICAIGPFLLDPVIQYFNIPLTEPYLVLGWAGALTLAAPLCSPPPPRPPSSPPSADRARVGRSVALGLVLATTTLFRSAGIALIPGVLLALAVHRRWKEAAACAGALLAPLLLWEGLQAYWMSRGPVSSQPDDLSYVRWLGVRAPVAFAGYAARAAAANIVEYVRKLAGYLFSSQVVGIGVVVVAAVAAAVACLRLRWSHTTLVLSAVFAIVLTLVWPYAQGRLILPLLPFLGLLAASTLQAGDHWAPARLKWALPAALGVTALVVTMRQVELRQAAERSFQSGVLPPPQDLTPTLTLAVRSRFIYRVVQWVRAHTAPEDRIMVDAPAGVYLYTGRRTVAALPTESRLGSSAFDVPGRYLAERILVDSVTFVLWPPPQSGLERDVMTIQARCPRVLQPEASDCAACFHIQRDEACLRQIVGQSRARAERS